MTALIVRLLEDPEDILAARRLQGRRYLDAGFVDRLRSDGTIEDPYLRISDWFGVADAEGRTVVGVARLIRHTPFGLPAIDEFDISAAGTQMLESINAERIAEVSALAVARGYGAIRGGEVAKALYRAMYQYSLLEAKYTHWVAAIDSRVKRHLVRSHGFLFEEIGESRMYLGSETVPVLLDLYAQMRHYALVDLRGGQYFSSGLVIDLTGDEPELIGETDGFVPKRGTLINL